MISRLTNVLLDFIPAEDYFLGFVTDISVLSLGS
jgi:hypothetical protein